MVSINKDHNLDFYNNYFVICFILEVTTQYLVMLSIFNWNLLTVFAFSLTEGDDVVVDYAYSLPLYNKIALRFFIQNQLDLNSFKFYTLTQMIYQIKSIVVDVSRKANLVNSDLWIWYQYIIMIGDFMLKSLFLLCCLAQNYLTFYSALEWM